MSHIEQKCDRLTQFFSTSEENKTLTKEDKVKRSPFYVEGDRGGWQKESRSFENFTYESIVWDDAEG
jgi:hypothetical protein